MLSHLPGAISAPYATVRGGSDNPGAVPDAEALETAFERWEYLEGLKNGA